LHSRFRDACLNREQPMRLTEARVIVEGSFTVPAGKGT
jgi:hypothetical protein